MEWVFSEKLMRKMGFCSRWVNLIMVCVRTISYSKLINGEPKGIIHPSWGLRQGDPLSPFLFLLCIEGLHGIIKKATRMGEINGFSLCKRGPKLTHLFFFADDNLIFCRANSKKYNNVLKLLSEYESISGQQINKEKTTMFLTKSTPDGIRQDIKRILGVQEIKFYEKYLGLPTLVDKDKKS